MHTPSLQHSDIILIISGIVMGTLARLLTLRADYRQTPSLPGGYFIHLVTGFIASILGAVAIPALFAQDFVAVTFLALAIQHFRDIRKLESESLTKLERTEYTRRGEAYIDGIAKTYEARNYISLLASLFTVLFMKIFYTDRLIIDCLIGLSAGSAVILSLRAFTKGKTIGSVCTVTEGKITTKQSELYVDGMLVTNLLGTEGGRRLFAREGAAVVITPKNEYSAILLSHYGQRQAILFEAVRSFGVKRYHFTRRSFPDGKVLLAFVPIVRDTGALIEVVKKTPILESTRKTNFMSKHKGGRQGG